MENLAPKQSELIVTTKNPDNHDNLWRNVILACAFLMLLVSLSAGAFVLATKKTVKLRNIPTSTTKLSGDYAPPTAVVHPPIAETESWKTYKTDFFSLQYPPEWISVKDTTVENGVKLFNPNVSGTSTASSSGKIVAVPDPTQYLLLAYHTASESAVQYVNKIQLNCCIGPSAVPGAAARFKKQSLTINGYDSQAYNPVTGTLASWNYVFSDTKRIIEIFTTAPTPTGNSVENRIVSTFTLIK
ncbi:hypothetical protein BH11PAT1_BH11PAT1_0350 [soil metagenome]